MSAPRAVSFWVPGPQVGVNRRYVKGHTLSREYREFMDRVRAVATRAMRNLQPLEGPLSFRAEFHFHNPRADASNPIKPCEDALNRIVYEDDSQIIESTGAKIVVPKTEPQGTVVIVREMV